VIPLRDENPTEIVPVVTVILIALNVAAWLFIEGAGQAEALQASVMTFGSVPCALTGACPPQGLGWLSIVTSMFIHGSWEHLLGNMLFFWVFGNNIEDSMGHLRFIFFYLICGIIASLANTFVMPESMLPTVGASGAISGIMGAYVVLYPRVKVRTWFPPIFFFNVSAAFMLGYWFLTQLVLGALTYAPQQTEVGGVAVWAHVGGFLAGVLLIRVFRKPALVEAKRRKVKLSPEEVARLGGTP
jgi:membrane associated rhomboid family serine protease